MPSARWCLVTLVRIRTVGGRLHRPDFQGGRTGRLAYPAADQPPARDQAQDLQGARHHCAASQVARADEVIEYTIAAIAHSRYWRARSLRCGDSVSFLR